MYKYKKLIEECTLELKTKVLFVQMFNPVKSFKEH